MYAKTTTTNISSLLFILSIETIILFSDKFSDLVQNFLTVNVEVDVKRIYNYRG